MKRFYIPSLLFLAASPLFADEVVLTPDQDATLIGSSAGSLANGGGCLFVGRTQQGGLASMRRGLIRFDVAAAIAPGSAIESVELTMRVTKVKTSSSRGMNLHRVLANWSEGATASCVGQGLVAATGDATWVHASFDTVAWGTPGGDFHTVPSATTMVGGINTYMWSAPGMVMDVQEWVNAPGDNYGWILVGDESAGATVKRFDSRESASHQPSLRVVFTPVQCEPCDTNCDAVVDAFDIEPFIALLVGGGTPCAPCAGDANGDEAIDAFDIEPFIDCLVGP